MDKKEAVEFMSRAILQIEKEGDLDSAEIKLFRSIDSRASREDWRVVTNIRLNAK